MHVLAGHSIASLHTQMRKVLAAQQQLPTHQIASIDSLHSLTGLSKRTVASALQACRLRELSLEASTVTCTSAGKAQDKTPLVDQMSSSDVLDHRPELDDPLADSCVAETLLEGALQKLPLAEATVLHHVYGLQDGLPKSRPQVSHAALLLKVCRQTTPTPTPGLCLLCAPVFALCSKCQSLMGVAVDFGLRSCAPGHKSQ